MKSLHAGIIMDGNGRWALERSLPRSAGHRAGADALRTFVEAAPSFGLGTLTAYAFSSGNWSRPASEVASLMSLLAFYLEEETTRCLKNGVRLQVIGRRDRLDPKLQRAIEATEKATRNGGTLHLRLAIDYSARAAILRAAWLAGGDPERFEPVLTDAPPVDLLIRTGGEQRLSDFLLWECAYAELFFTSVMWPDFSPGDLGRVMSEFHRRERRFGGLPSRAAGAAPSRDPEYSERWLR